VLQHLYIEELRVGTREILVELKDLIFFK
jgi:hypothetical protein